MKASNQKSELEKVLKECEKELVSLQLIEVAGRATDDLKFNSAVFRYVWLKLKPMMKEAPILEKGSEV